MNAPSGADPVTDELPRPVLGSSAPVADEPRPPLAAASAVAGSGPGAADPGARPADDGDARPADDPGARPVDTRRRALLGAVVALAGVCLGIGALLLLGGNSPDRAGSTTATGRGPVAAQPAGGPAGTGAAAAPGAVPPAGTDSRAVPAPGAGRSAGTGTGAATVPPAGAPDVPVVVLNNSRTAGLAGRSAARFRRGGWRIPVIGNFRGRLSATTLYYAAGQAAAAQRFARQFGIPRVLPRFTGLPGAGLTVVLTRDVA